MTRTTAAAAGILGLCMACASPALAQVQELASSGLWKAYTESQPGSEPLCGIATVGSDGRRIAIEQTRGQAGLSLILNKPSWTIPDGTPVELRIRFDRSAPIDAHATGSGQQLTVSMTFTQSVPFMRGVRYGMVMQVYFLAGNEPFWSGGLSGSSRSIDSFNDCRTRLVPTAPTQPYAAPATPQPAPPTGPTQPFTAAPQASAPPSSAPVTSMPVPPPAPQPATPPPGLPPIPPAPGLSY
jgi:hypothetical protein